MLFCALLLVEELEQEEFAGVNEFSEQEFNFKDFLLR